MATDLSLINAAATRTGSDTITSLDQGGAVASVATQNYENIVLAELSAHRWKWATKISVLNLLDPDVNGTPPEPWGFAYQLPTDVLDLRTVMVGGAPVQYAVFSDKILTDQDGAAEVVAHYIWRPPESRWPRWFAEPITRRMEAVFLRAIGERFAEAAARDKEADLGFAQARRMDAQSDTARDPFRYRILDARRA